MPAHRPMPDPLVEHIAQRFRALGEPARLRILERLRFGPCSVAQLARDLGQPPQDVSTHLQLLASLGIVSRAKESGSSSYAIADESVVRICDDISRGVRPRIAGGPRRSSAPQDRLNVVAAPS